MGCNLSVEDSPDFSSTVCFLGLDGSGKSEIVYNLVNTEPSKKYVPVSTAGVEYHELPIGSTYLKIYDCGGMGKYRELWPQFIRQSDGVVFVIDRSDKERMSRVREEIEEVMGLCNALSLPLLIFANKSDIDSTLKTQEINQITRASTARIEYTIKECSAKTGDGLSSGRDWLLQHLKPRSQPTQVN